MKTYFVSYRGEFVQKVKAKNETDAIRKFGIGKEKIEVLGNLYPEYFAIEVE